MHEFLPQRRHIFTTTPEDLDDDYDEYLFYPSENRMIHLEPFLPSPAPEQFDADHEYVSSSSDLSEVPWGSVQSLPHLDHLLKLPSSPTYSIDSSFVFPERVDDQGIRVLGYSKLFRTGLLAKVSAMSVPLLDLLQRALWPQSCSITRRMDAFFSKMTSKLRALKSRFAQAA